MPKAEGDLTGPRIIDVEHARTGSSRKAPKRSGNVRVTQGAHVERVVKYGNIAGIITGAAAASPRRNIAIRPRVSGVIGARDPRTGKVERRPLEDGGSA